MRAGDDVGDQLGFYRIGDRRLQDAYDGRRTRAFIALQAHCFSDHAGVGGERGAPKPVGEHGCAWGVGAVVAGAEQASKDRVQTHHFKVIAIYYAAFDFARGAEADDGEGHLGEGAEFLNCFQAAAKILNLGNGKGLVCIVDSRGALQRR